MFFRLEIYYKTKKYTYFLIISALKFYVNKTNNINLKYKWQN